jgi:hypothetical protein
VLSSRTAASATLALNQPVLFANVCHL